MNCHCEARSDEAISSFSPVIPAKAGIQKVLASKRNGTLYLGVTSNLVQRICQHKNDLVEGFTNRYGVLSEWIAVFTANPGSQ